MPRKKTVHRYWDLSGVSCPRCNSTIRVDATEHPHAFLALRCPLCNVTVNATLLHANLHALNNPKANPDIKRSALASLIKTLFLFPRYTPKP